MSRGAEIMALKNVLTGRLQARPEIRRTVIETPNFATGPNDINIWVLPSDDHISLKLNMKSIVDHEIAQIDHGLRNMKFNLRGVGSYVPYKLDVRGVINPRIDLLFHEVWDIVYSRATSAVLTMCHLNSGMRGLSTGFRNEVNSDIRNQIDRDEHIFLPLIKLKATAIFKSEYTPSMAVAPKCEFDDITVVLYPKAQQGRYEQAVDAMPKTIRRYEYPNSLDDKGSYYLDNV